MKFFTFILKKLTKTVDLSYNILYICACVNKYIKKCK